LNRGGGKGEEERIGKGGGRVRHDI